MLIVMLASALLLMPAPVGPAPTEIGPEDGCKFAQLVLNEIEKERTRILFEMNSATGPRKVVLVVQELSGDNLRRSTQEWTRKNCITV